MSVKITIQGQIIEFPVSGDPADWGPAVTEFAQATEQVINSVAGTFDVAPQVQNIDSANPSTNIDITALIFPPVNVQASTIFYAVYRQTNETSLFAGDNQAVSEAGQLEIVYNNALGVFELSRIGTGDAKIDFDITNVGQVRFTTQTLTGINHIGRITFRALSVLNS